MEDDKDPTDIPILPHDDLRNFLAGKSGLPSGQTYRDHQTLVIAEITRLQTNAQIKQMQAQERQLEAQGEQIEAQGKQIATQTAVARSLRNATWVLVGATVLLAVATLVPWIWPAH